MTETSTPTTTTVAIDDMTPEQANAAIVALPVLDVAAAGPEIDAREKMLTALRARVALTGRGQLFDSERRYVAITLTDALREAIYTRMRDIIAAGTATTSGLLLRDIVAHDLNVTVDTTRAPSTGTKTADEKRTAAINNTAHIAGLKAQHAAAMRDTAYTPKLNDATYTAAYDATVAKLRAADLKKLEAATAPTAPTTVAPTA